MSELTVSGSFILTIGHGDGPEVELFLSVCNPDGSPANVPFQTPEEAAGAIEVFTGLTAMFGTMSIPCVITQVETAYPPSAGYVSMTIQDRFVGEVGRLDAMGLAAVGVTVQVNGDRGQAVLVGSIAATPQQWWPAKLRER